MSFRSVSVGEGLLRTWPGLFIRVVRAGDDIVHSPHSKTRRLVNSPHLEEAETFFSRIFNSSGKEKNEVLKNY